MIKLPRYLLVQERVARDHLIQKCQLDWPTIVRGEGEKVGLGNDALDPANDTNGDNRKSEKQ